MAGLISRISLTGEPADSPEDFLASALATLDPEDSPDIHGDADHGLLYTSPHLPKPLHIDLADPAGEEDRKLFSHYLWNASLLLADFIEAGTLDLDAPGSGKLTSPNGASVVSGSHFNVQGQSMIELGAGTALPSFIAALLGASHVVATDYPAPRVMTTLRTNVARNVRPELSPTGTVCQQVFVEGHAWGEVVSGTFASSSRGQFTRVLAADCLWMPWQHANLRRSIGWFLADTEDARAWVVAGFHTGRARMAPFFDEAELAKDELEVEAIWERDVEGNERSWAVERQNEDPGSLKRWLVVAVLKRMRW